MSSSEYLELGPEFDMISCLVRETFPQSCIVWIEKNHNLWLKQLYDDYRQKLSPTNERMLFHGTSEPIARSIMKEGFDPTKCVSACNGVGIYFSPAAQVSASYSRGKQDQNSNIDLAFMLCCDVALGTSCRLGWNQKIPQGFNSGESYQTPPEYVIDKREAAYPKYLIAFYPDADYYDANATQPKKSFPGMIVSAKTKPFQ